MNEDENQKKFQPNFQNDIEAKREARKCFICPVHSGENQGRRPRPKKVKNRHGRRDKWKGF